MHLIFRQLDENNPCDLDQFNELMDDLSCRADDPEILKRQISKINQANHCYLMVAEEQISHRLVGSLLGVLVDDYCGSCRPLLLIENVVTHHAYQRSGIGKQMFAHMENWARQQDVNYIILCSGMQRKGAHAFYHALGYDEVKGFKKYL